MTRAPFQDDSGRLRLEPELFDALLSWAEGGEVDRERWLALSGAGLVLGDQPHPRVAGAVAAMADPMCVTSLQSNAVDDGSGIRGAGWMSGESAALLLDAPDGRVELACLPPMSVPAALARLLGLSPRPLPAAPAVQLRATVVDEFFTVRSPHRSLTSHPVLEAIGLSTVTDAFRWDVATRWPGAGEVTHSGRLRVIDSPDGLWGVTTSEAERLTLQPTTPTAVWRLLLRQFPP